MSTSRIKGMTVDIGGDTSSFQNAMKKLEGSISKCQTSLKNINSALKLNPSSTVLLSNKQEILASKIFETKEKLKTLQASLAEVNKYAKENGGLTEEQHKQYINLTTEIAKTEGELKNLEGQYKSFGSVNAQVVKVAGEKMMELGNTITKVDEKLAKVSAVSAAALGAITKTSIDFESAWTGVTKTVDGSEQELANVRKEILKLASATGTSSSEIAGVAEAAGQLGVGVKDVSAFTETMVRLGDSTNLSAEEASTSIAQFYNIMNQDLSTVDRFGAALVALGNNSATSESKIMDMASRIAGSGSQIGLTSQQVLALAASLSSVGIEAEMGGSAISTIMTNIDKEVALNGKHLKTWAETAGMSAKDFKKLWATDTMSAIQAVVKGMGEVKDEGGNLNVLLDELGIKNIRQADTMKRLSNASDLLTNSLQISNNAWDENSALTNESQKRYQTTAAKLGQVKETLKEVAISLGDVVLPYVQQFADKLKELVEKFTNLDEGQKKMIVTILGVTAVIAPLLIIVGGLITKIGMFMTYAPAIVSAFSTIKSILVGVKTAFAAVGAVIGTISAPILIVIGVVAALIAVFVLLYNKCEWFRNGVNAIVQNIKEFVVNAITQIGIFFTVTIPSWIDLLVNEILPHLPYYIGYAIGWILGKIAEFIANVWKTIITKVPQIIAKIVQFVSELPGKLWTWFLAVLEKVNEWLSNWLQTMKERIPQIISAIVDKIMELPGKMLDIGRNIVEGLWNGIQNAKDWIIGKIREFARGILDGMKNALGIHSPSTIFRDQVGRYIAEGIGVGFDQNIGSVVNDMQKKIGIETSKLSADVGLVANADSLNRVSPTTNNISIVVNAQTLNEESLEQAFVYINRKFGMSY